MIDALNSAHADCASPIISESCNWVLRPGSVKTETVSDPISLYDRLIAVKPPGLSAHAWSQRAGLSRNVFADIRRRGNANHTTIEKLVGAIGLTWAEFEAGMPQPEKEAPSPAVQAPRMAFQGQDRPRDVPVLGTAECGELDVEGAAVESMELFLDDVVDHVRRPVTLDNRRDAYAIYFQGSSMAPRYESGEIAYVDPRRPPAQLDYVVLQLRRPDGDHGERVYRVLAKRLIRRTAAFYELEQFNPPRQFRIPVAQVAHCHRIYDWTELVAF